MSNKLLNENPMVDYEKTTAYTSKQNLETITKQTIPSNIEATSW
jgi:hypothetical protein